MGKFILWRYPARWSVFRVDDRLLLIFFGAIVGILSGLAAVALNRSLTASLNFVHSYRHFWWAFTLPAIGAAFSSIFLNKIVKDGGGHGVPEVISSVSRYGGLLRFRSGFSRLVSSCLTIGSGGSAGPEAPVVMSGSAIGSNIAQFFSFNDRQRVTLVGCGAAAAISSIFNAPVAGMIFTMEVILGEWSTVNIIPIAIASVVGTKVSHFFQGDQIAFGGHKFNIQVMDIVACIGLAVLTAAASIFLTRLLRKMHHVSSVSPGPLWLKAAFGGCLVGIIGFAFPEVLGEGYHSITAMIGGVFEKGFYIAALCAIFKVIATSLTIGWGGSGGIFAPCLVIGSFTGIFFQRGLGVILPDITWVSEGCFALFGMAGLISGILQAPLTGIFLIVEITGSYEVILPLIVVSAFSTTICRYFEPASFYLKDLVEKGQLLRPGTDSRVLSDLSISELMEKDFIVVKKDMLLRDFLSVAQKSRRNYFPVEDPETGEYVGMLHWDHIRPYLFNQVMYDTVFVDQIMDAYYDTAKIDDDLTDILLRMDSNNLFSMPVILENKFIGMISKANLLNHYRKELMVQTSVA